MGFKLYLIAFMVVLAMVARSSAKVHDASWGVSHFVAYDDESNSKVGDVGQENELLMDSDSGRTTLKSNSRFIGYGALRPDAVPCGRRGQSYYNCKSTGEFIHTARIQNSIENVRT